ncbi:MAG: flavin reductase [Nitratireductor sp.]|uniref:flavin reductase n=1 Tax=Parvibaculum sp. TaxID=2024848 RepID=UPI00327F3202
MLKTGQIEPRSYRDAMANFAGAVHVITTNGAAGRRGVTVIAACSVSDTPPTVLVCLNRDNRANDCFAENGVFALNTLAAGHQPLAAAFAGLTGLTQADRFAAAEWETISTGAPALSGAIAVFDCRIVAIQTVATHRILIGRVAGLRCRDSTQPLLYFRRDYRGLQRSRQLRATVD